MLAAALTMAATALPAGMHDAASVTRELDLAKALALRTDNVARHAQVSFLASRYRRPPEHVRAVVLAAERAGARHGLPPALLLAMVETESSFNAQARSGYGARGLMQIVPRHHPVEIAAAGGVHRLDETDTNIAVGAAILAHYVNRSGDLRRGLKKYSGGAANYAAKVLKRKREIEQVGIIATRNLDSPLVVADTLRGSARVRASQRDRVAQAPAKRATSGSAPAHAEADRPIASPDKS